MLNASAINNLEVRGQDEDGDILRDVVCLVISDDQGARWIGPEIGFLSTLGREEVERKIAILQAAITECGLDPRSAWTPWFPIYGSQVYEASNQEALDIWVEKQNDRGDDRPYIPAEQL